MLRSHVLARISYLFSHIYIQSPVDTYNLQKLEGNPGREFMLPKLEASYVLLSNKVTQKQSDFPHLLGGLLDLNREPVTWRGVRRVLQGRILVVIYNLLGRWVVITGWETA